MNTQTMAGSLEKRYSEDYKLEHTRLDFILCYIDEINKYLKGNMELFGHSYLVKTFNEKGEEWYSIKGNSQGEEIEYKIYEIKDNLISMEISNLKIKVLLSDYIKLKEYLEKINQEPNTKKKQKAITLLDRVSKLLTDEKLIEMMNNFINEIPAELFFSPQLIAQVEALIAFKFGRLDYLLFSDEILRAMHCSIEEETVYNQVTTTINFENEETILSYFSNGLTFIFDLIEEHTGLEENDVAYISYSLLNKLAYMKYSVEWQDEYGFDFDNVKNLNLDELLEIYINLDSIDPSNIITAGQFISYLMKWCKFTNNDNYCSCFNEFVDLYSIAEQQKKKSIFRNRISSKRTETQTIKIDDIDLMDGREFEEFIAKLFKSLGYSTEVTKHSGDQGIDIIAEKNGMKIGIQAKCYSGNVGNSAIQEVATGKNHYKLDKAIVVTNNFFTPAAIELANSNGVILWDRNILKEKLTK